MSQLVRKILRQTDRNAGRFLSSRSAWDRAKLGPSVLEMVTSGQGPTQLAYQYVPNRGRQISDFFCNVKRKCAFAKNEGAGVTGC